MWGPICHNSDHTTNPKNWPLSQWRISHRLPSCDRSCKYTHSKLYNSNNFPGTYPPSLECKQRPLPRSQTSCLLTHPFQILSPFPSHSLHLAHYKTTNRSFLLFLFSCLRIYFKLSFRTPLYFFPSAPHNSTQLCLSTERRTWPAEDKDQTTVKPWGRKTGLCVLRLLSFCWCWHFSVGRLPRGKPTRASCVE